MKNINKNEKKKNLYYRWFLIRWFIIIILFSISIIRIAEIHQTTTFIFLATFLAVVTLNFIFYLNFHRKHYLILSLQIILDIIYATIVVHLTGGINSSFVWIYLMPVITASICVESQGGIISALMGSASLLFLIILYKMGWLIPIDSLNFSEIIPSQLTIFLISYTGLFVSVAAMLSFIKDNLTKKNTDVVHLNDQVTKLEEKTRLDKEQIGKFKKMEKNMEKLSQACQPIIALDHELNTPLTIIMLNLRKIEKAANKFGSEKLSDTANDITEALNKIKTLLKRIDIFKKNPLVNSDNQENMEE